MLVEACKKVALTPLAVVNSVEFNSAMAVISTLMAKSLLEMNLCLTEYDKILTCSVDLLNPVHRLPVPLSAIAGILCSGAATAFAFRTIKLARSM